MVLKEKKKELMTSRIQLGILISFDLTPNLPHTTRQQRSAMEAGGRASLGVIKGAEPWRVPARPEMWFL